MKLRAPNLLAVLVAGVAGLVVLSGCADAPDRGTVTGRKHQDAYSYEVPTCLVYGSYGQCTIWSSYTQQVPETWELCLISSAGDTGCRNVTREEYDAHPVGSLYGDPR